MLGTVATRKDGSQWRVRKIWNSVESAVSRKQDYAFVIAVLIHTNQSYRQSSLISALRRAILFEYGTLADFEGKLSTYSEADRRLPKFLRPAVSIRKSSREHRRLRRDLLRGHEPLGLLCQWIPLFRGVAMLLVPMSEDNRDKHIYGLHVETRTGAARTGLIRIVDYAAVVYVQDDFAVLVKHPETTALTKVENSYAAKAGYRARAKTGKDAHRQQRIAAIRILGTPIRVHVESRKRSAQEDA
jgi:hypothetical protein